MRGLDTWITGHWGEDQFCGYCHGDCECHAPEETEDSGDSEERETVLVDCSRCVSPEESRYDHEADLWDEEE